MDQDNRFAALTWVGTGYFCEVDLYWNYVIHLSYYHAHAVKRRGDLMVMRSTPDRVVFLGKTLYSHSASLLPGVQMGTSKYAGGNPATD